MLEALASVGIFALAAAAALAASVAGARIVDVPVPRDTALSAARNAVVEARAAAVYDAAAVAAILAAPPATWNADGTRLSSSIDAGALVLTATSGTRAVRMRYPVAREALPQGTIVDLSGTTVGP